MSSSEPIRGPLRALAALAIAFGLASCTFAPLYGTDTTTINLYSFDYGAPTNRLEQIIYSELGTEFGNSAPNAGQLSVTTTQSARRVARSARVAPNITYEAVVTGKLVLTKNEETVLTLTRRATASFTQNGQILADRQAETDASERAALALAGNLRFALIAALAGK